MFLGDYQPSALGRVWVPDKFCDDEIGTLPGFICDRFGKKLFLDTLDGWVHEYEECDEYPQSIDGFFSSIRRRVKKVFKKIVSIPKRIHKEAMRSLKKANARRKKITKSVLKNKYARQVVRVVGVAFAPFTGGLSLAAAEAAARYGKARYVQGKSRSSAFKRGAVGAVIGYAGGKAVSAGYSAVANRGASAAASSAAARGATTVATSAATTTGGSVATGASGGLWGNIGSTALKIGAKLAPTIVTTLLTARGQAGGGGVQEVVYQDGAYADPYGYAPEGYADYGSYSDAGAYENAFAPGGSTVVPDGVYDEEGNLIEDVGASASSFAPLAIIAVGAVAGVLLLKPKKRGRK